MSSKIVASPSLLDEHHAMADVLLVNLSLLGLNGLFDLLHRRKELCKETSSNLIVPQGKHAAEFSHVTEVDLHLAIVDSLEVPTNPLLDSHCSFVLRELWYNLGNYFDIVLGRRLLALGFGV